MNISSVGKIDEVVTTVSQHRLPYNKLFKATNAWINNGQVRVRPGFESTNTAITLSTLALMGHCHFVDHNSTQYDIIKEGSSGGAYYGIQFTNSGGVSLGSLTVQSYRPAFEEYDGILYVCDHSAKKIHTGSGSLAMETSGLATSTVTTSTAIAGGTPLTTTGPTYYFRVANVNANCPIPVVSIPGAVISHAGNTAFPGVQINTGSKPDSQITHIDVYYGGTSSSAGPYYFSERIAWSGTTVSLTTLSQNTLLPISLITDNNQITDSVVGACRYKNRMFYAVESSNKIIWSKPFEPEHIPSANVFYVGQKKEAIVGILSYDGYMLILKEHSVWVFAGEDEPSFRADLALNEGTNDAHTRAFLKLNNELYFFQASSISSNQQTVKRFVLGDRLVDILANINSDSGSNKVSTYAVLVQDQLTNCVWILDHLSIAPTTTTGYIYNPDTSKVVGIIQSSYAALSAWRGVIFSFVISTYNRMSRLFWTAFSGGTDEAFTFEVETGGQIDEFCANLKLLKQLKLVKAYNTSSAKTFTLKVVCPLDVASNKTLDTLVSQTSALQKNYGVDLFQQAMAVNVSGSSIDELFVLEGFEYEFERIGQHGPK